MPVNPYDDRKITLRRPHGNGDLDIVRTSYTRRKANVTEALGLILLQMSTETLSGWTRWVITGCIIGIKSSAIIALFFICVSCL